MSNPGDKNELFEMTSVSTFLAGYAGRLREALVGEGSSFEIEIFRVCVTH